MSDNLAEYDDALRDRLTANLGRHERLTFPLEGRKHAAVAVVVVDSGADDHGDDRSPFSAEEMARIPGAEGLSLTGSITGTAGGPAVVLTRRAAGLSPTAALLRGLVGQAVGLVHFTAVAVALLGDLLADTAVVGDGVVALAVRIALRHARRVDFRGPPARLV